MKKALVILTACLALSAAGCSNKSPDITPSPSVTASASATNSPVITESTTAPTTKHTTTAPDPTTNAPDPTTPSAAPSTTEAGTPAVQFASRWGKKYPSVQEFQILKAANTTCEAITDGGEKWNQNTNTLEAISAAVTNAGMNVSDATEFAQDANQNYCSTLG